MKRILSLNTLLFQYAWTGFRRRKTRFAASIAGYGLAVFIFVVILTLSSQTKSGVEAVLTHTGTHFIAFKPVCCNPGLFKSKEEGFYASGIPSQPFSLGLIDEIRTLPSVVDASPFISVRIMQDNDPVMVGGFDPGSTRSVENTSCAASDLVSGRFLQPRDSGLIMLEESYARTQGLSTGDSLTLKGVTYPVLGIVDPGIRPAKADVYMTFHEAERLIARTANTPVTGLMNIILVESAGAHIHAQAVLDVREKIGSTGLISSYGCHKPASAAMTVQSQAFRGLAVIIYLFAALLALKTQFTSIDERKRDLGILAALGWPMKAVTGLLFYESMIPAVIGALSGAVVSLAVWGTLSLLNPLDPALSPLPLITIGIGIALFSGLAAGLLASWKVRMTAPADQLNVI